jgi:hypothetical protein
MWADRHEPSHASFALASRRWHLRRAAVIVLACVACACGKTGDSAPELRRAPIASRPAPQHAATAQGAAQARAVAQDYLDSLARGDGKAACRLLSPDVISDTGDYPTRGACVRELSDVRELGRFQIVNVEMQSPTWAIVWIDARPYSDTGYDNLPVQRYGDRWLLEGS